MKQPEYIGKYEVVDLVGKGSMGLVYKGFDPHIRRAVALKTIRRDRLSSDVEDSLVRFKHEAQAIGRLSHNGIVSVYDFGEEEDYVFLVMEFVEGHNLNEYFSQGRRFSIEDSVSIVAQLLDALDHAHEQGVIHRDIKPANIILKSNGMIKIADFGIAHIYSSEITEVGLIMGTPCYMAPEQFRGEQVDCRADLYSVGVLFFQLLTGLRPFNGTYDQLIYSVCNQPAPHPSLTVSNTIISKYDNLVEKALRKSPADRFSTAREFRKELLDIYSSPFVKPVSGDTIIHEGISSAGQQVQNAGDVSSSKSVSVDKSLTPLGWDPLVLRTIEKQLAEFVGPFSHIMVKNAALSTTDPETLYLKLAEELDNSEDRSAFLKFRLQGISNTNAVSMAPPSNGSHADENNKPITALSGQIISDEKIDAATRELSSFLGPISKVVVKRAASQCTNIREFYEQLAGNIPDENDRKKFIKAIGFTG